MSLIRKASRVAVAISVHGWVQRRQQSRWAAEQQQEQPVPARRRHAGRLPFTYRDGPDFPAESPR